MMRNVEYIIVGGGYAGVFFAHQLLMHGKSFVLFSDQGPNASRISAGVCNPLILRYYTKIWNTEPLMGNLYETFEQIREYLGKQYLSSKGVVRVFNNEHERKEWIHKAHRPGLEAYINSEIIHLKNIVNPFGAAHVDRTTRLRVSPFFKDFFAYLQDKGFLIPQHFNYADINLQERTYQDFKFDKIIFAEGVAVAQNPFFLEMPVIPNKGHRLTVKLDKELDDFVIKTKHFLFHLQDNEYFYGATYDRESHDLKIQQEKVEELLSCLKLYYKDPVEVMDVLTAFRATTFDRRPIVGRHHEIPFLYILNGLGARGVLNGAFFSKMLFDHIETGRPIFLEADVKNIYNNTRKRVER